MIRSVIDTTLRESIECNTADGVKKLYVTKFNETFVFSDTELPSIEAMVANDNFFRSLFGPVKSSGIEQGIAQKIAETIIAMNEYGRNVDNRSGS
jgi:hypothetical protein